jgi:hypothetical protein
MCNILPVSEIRGSHIGAIKTACCMLGSDIMYVPIVCGTVQAGVYKFVIYQKDSILYVTCRFSGVYVVFCVARL